MQIELNDVIIRYELTGPEAAPVVAMSHCLAGSMAIWNPQMDVLQEKFRVLRYDIRGHGGSSAPAENYTMEMLASDAISIMDALQIENVHFMGISLGGMIGQTLALRYPERVSSLILCDTTCAVPEAARQTWEERIALAREKGMAALADATLERWLSARFRDNNPEITRRIKDIILATPVSGFVGCIRAIAGFDVTDELAGLSVPSLIMVGENDPGTPVESARQIRDAVAGAVMVELPGAFHLSNIEAAGSFNENLTAFLAKQ